MRGRTMSNRQATSPPPAPRASRTVPARVAFAAAILVCAPVRPLSAQAPLEPGTRVRLTVPCDAPGAPPSRSPAAECQVIGRLAYARADTLALATEGPILRYGAGTVRRLEVSAGPSSHRLTGTLAGLLIGAAATYVILNRGGSTSLCDREANQDAVNGRECALLYAAGGVAGGALGAWIGGRMRSERWHGVPLPGIRVGFALGAGRPSLGVTASRVVPGPASLR